MSNVQFNAAAMDYLLKSSEGDVGRHIGKMGIRIVAMAQRLCGVGTGKLARSISKRQARMAGGQYLSVYSNVSYAYFVHEGTHPHVIDPPGDRIMAFNSGGKRVYAQQVHHPGTRGKRYLTIPLRQVLR